MARYRAKPVELEAVQFTGANMTEVKEFAGVDVDMPANHPRGFPLRNIIVHTTEGSVQAPRGHYIVRDDRGNHYPCDPGVFERKYEPIDG